MSLKINYINTLNKSAKNKAIFLTMDSNISDFKGIFDEKINKKIVTFLKNIKKNNKNKIFSINQDFDQKIIIILLSRKNDLFESEKIGAQFYDYIKNNHINDVVVLGSSFISVEPNLNFDSFLHGAELKSYEFNIYKSDKVKKIISFNVLVNKNNSVMQTRKKLNALLNGVNFTKDLVSEPGNILHPDEYAKRIMGLKKLGLKITVYDEKKLKKMGCNALLGVGQGSIRGSYLVTMEWNGKKSKSKPLAFVGKGVCFDTGGISLKPAKFMEDMTYDMAGSAVVVGLMKNFALRKAKINAVGVVGLVENMPGGNAQRPGDIVKSYSGKTIEVLNTDAEGRLVLADAITFTEKKFKPSFIVDLATLTGAIIVSLGSEYAGLFSNNDKLSKQIYDAGQKVREKVWRLPLHKNFDKLMNSKNADMQNINYVGGAGSITAAQFLQRFILNKTPWVHLDIAGMAFSKYGGALNSGGATGYGVRLLNKLVEDNYE
ncbi:MAG: leucyl aminopeptidase [Pelagibacteraceae bacterium TMED287]|nr:MAG: leucyl aminopeptidase [Pelagibacteraceae bacterium TMED287]|tara:strand:+ start:5265 stop:6728 length:1464 start_codon:yes stop_codon:yes gene_type:complete